MKGSQHRQFATFVARTALDRELERLNADWNPMYDLIVNVIFGYDDLASAIGDKVGTLPDSAEEYLWSWICIGHRTYLHSVDVYRALEEEKERIRQVPSPNPQSDAIRVAAIEAYQSHIFLDSTTPMGVPEYGWLQELLKKWRSKSQPNNRYKLRTAGDCRVPGRRKKVHVKGPFQKILKRQRRR